MSEPACIPEQQFPKRADLLLVSLRRLAYPWRALTIGIDGRNGAGKSTLARYLAWELGMPAIETDLWIDSDSAQLRYDNHQLLKIIRRRHSRKRPIIIEGICLLDRLSELGVNCDYLIWVTHPDDSESDTDDDPARGPLTQTLDAYICKRAPKARADYVFSHAHDED